MNQLPRHHLMFVSNARVQLSAGLRDLFFNSGRMLWALSEFIILYVVFIAAWWSSPYGIWWNLDTRAFVLAFFYSSTFALVSLGLGQYERFRWFNYFRVFLKTITAASIACAFSIALVYLWYYDSFGRLTVAWGVGCGLLVILGFRAIVAYLLSLFPYRVAIIGNSRHLEEIANFIQEKLATETKHLETLFFSEDVSIDFLKRQIDSDPARDFVVSKTFVRRPDFDSLALASIQKGIRIIDEESFYEDIFERISVEGFSVETLIVREYNNRRLLNDLVKRLIDIVFSGLGLIFLLPILLLIALAIKFSSKGPVTFIQPRQGRAGRPFNMYKFRTMHLDSSCAEASGGFTKKDDDRIIWIGKFLRPLHLDELPQLINIFLGQMSLVGPRPEALQFAKRMAQEIPQYSLRYIARPGLTGHAQLMAGYMMDTVEDTRKKLSYDLYYVVRQSLFFDFTIIMRTFFIVLKKVFL